MSGNYRRNDLTTYYNNAISALNVAHDGGDFEVQGAMNAAVTALEGLQVSARRAAARYEIEAAKLRIERAMNVLEVTDSAE